MKSLALFSMALTVMLSSGCASLGTSTQQTAEQLVVEYATLKVIGAEPMTAARQAKAARILAIAVSAKADLSDPAATLATVLAKVTAQIAAEHLAPADQMLANALVETVSAELQAKIGAGVLDPAKVTTANTVLGWVVEAASFPVS
jgi:uncharacterized protein YceK